jgi:hypothetical protein
MVEEYLLGDVDGGPPIPCEDLSAVAMCVLGRGWNHHNVVDEYGLGWDAWAMTDRTVPVLTHEGMVEQRPELRLLNSDELARIAGGFAEYEEILARI